MIDAKKLFDAIRDIKGKGLTQAEVDTINAILSPVMAEPIKPAPPVSSNLIPPHPKLPNAVLVAALKSQAKYGIPASVTLAQFAVESAWGTRMPLNSFNPFGIKARVLNGKILDPYVNANTREEDFKGQKEWHGPQPFRKFNNFDEAFEVHGKLLGTAGVYANARKMLPDPDRFADALTGVYATAKNYGATLKSIMRTQNLYVYNGIKL